MNNDFDSKDLGYRSYGALLRYFHGDFCPLGGLTDPVPIHFHCIEEKSIDIVHFVDFYVLCNITF